MNNRSTDVLIVGAGPTGLVLAIVLATLGTRVRVVDKTAEPGTTSRALAVQARTLELYDALGLGDEVVRRGLRLGAVNLWRRGERAARIELGPIGRGVSPVPSGSSSPRTSTSACSSSTSKASACGSSGASRSRPSRTGRRA
jgi:2-polyprenyl-6-methoxyphenol hydroxylase-like FAD-dependent oxidoreductase